GSRAEAALVVPVEAGDDLVHRLLVELAGRHLGVDLVDLQAVLALGEPLENELVDVPPLGFRLAARDLLELREGLRDPPRVERLPEEEGLLMDRDEIRDG